MIKQPFDCSMEQLWQKITEDLFQAVVKELHAWKTFVKWFNFLWAKWDHIVPLLRVQPGNIFCP